MKIDWLRVGARVKIVEGRDDARKGWLSCARGGQQREKFVEPQRRQALSLHILLHAGAEVRAAVR